MTNPKTRGNYTIPFCIRAEKCTNRSPDNCETCFKYANYKELAGTVPTGGAK